MLLQKINKINDKIALIKEINGFNKTCGEINVIHKEIEECKKECEGYELKINSVHDKFEKLEINITDDDYAKNLIELNYLVVNLENMEKSKDFDEVLKNYENALLLIKQCENYLNFQKTEIIYLDKK